MVGKFVSLRIVELKVMEGERRLESDGGGGGGEGGEGDAFSI